MKVCIVFLQNVLHAKRVYMLIGNACINFKTFLCSKSSTDWNVAQKQGVHSSAKSFRQLFMQERCVLLLSQCRLFRQGVAEIGSVAQTLSADGVILNLW